MSRPKQNGEVWSSHRAHNPREPWFKSTFCYFMLKMKALSDGKTVLWDTSNPHATAVVYAPRPDKNERLYNSQ